VVPVDGGASGEAMLESCAWPGHVVVARRDGRDRNVLKLMRAPPERAAKLIFGNGKNTFVRWREPGTGEELFARHQFSVLKMHPHEDGELFQGDATWTAQRGLSECTDEAREAAQQEHQRQVEQKVRENAGAKWSMMLQPAAAQHDVTQRVFLDVAIGEAPPRRLVIGLYGNAVPKTAYNFYMLCTGELGSAKNGAALHYKGTKLHRVIPGFMAQGGDISRGTGGAGDSVFGGHFEDENFLMKHAAVGALSMANYGKDTNLSQFFLAFVPLGYLDGKHVVFGQVLEGLDVLRLMEAAGSQSGQTKVPIVVVDSGACPPSAPCA